MRERRKAAERAILRGKVDPFIFELCKDLGMSLEEARRMPHADYVQWRAFYQYDRASRNLRAKTFGR